MPADSSKLIDRLFRHHYGRLVAGLTRVFGPARIDLVEDVVQEALLRACRSWPFRGVPDQPEAWLDRVARNLAIDVIRRGNLALRVERDLQGWAEQSQVAVALDPDQVRDDTLRMIFTCCHPALPETSRVVLTLKTLCGLGVEEIARGLRAKEATVAQRLSRAKARLQAESVEFVVPVQSELPARLDSVLAVLYLLFNEGYAAHAGDDLVRHELVAEAVRLLGLLLEMDETARPETHALMALVMLQGSRLPARVGEDGSVQTLASQDRRLWDRSMIGRGFLHLQQAAAGDRLTPYHAEAAIASVHAAAASHAATNWTLILQHYDQLLTMRESAIVRLNRAVALAQVQGCAAALAELDQLQTAPELRSYHLLPATRAMLLWQLERRREAERCFEEALRLVGTQPERNLLQQRLQACRNGAPVEEM